MDASAANEMTAIAPGQVTLSDRRTRRSWPVELAPYQLAAFPVPQARYAQVTGQRPSTTQGDQLPVDGVSWLDAVRFCNALSQREGLALGELTLQLGQRPWRPLGQPAQPLGQRGPEGPGS